MNLLLVAVTLLLALNAWGGTPAHTVAGDLEIQPFTSKIFNNTRNLRVLLPPGYHDMINRHRQYPVMYLQDGQNLFDEATAFAHEWQVDETMERLWAAHKIEPMVIVGIDNAQEKRAEEYLPYRDENFSPQVTRPRADDYAEFLLTEVMPYIQNRYRIKPGAENTGMGGSSYGGLVTLYTAMQRPDVFGRVLLESMPLHIEKGRLVEDAKATKQWPQRVFLGIGTKEMNSPAMAKAHVEWTWKLADALHAHGLGDNRVKVLVGKGAEHNEQAWAARFPDAMLFLWRK